MAGNLTAGGLGQPGGLLVTGGMGAAETDPSPPDPNAIRAHLYGSGTLTGNLTATSTVPAPGWVPFDPGWRPKRPTAVPGHMAAQLHGSGALVGTLDGPLIVPPWVDQLLDLLMFDLV